MPENSQPQVGTVIQAGHQAFLSVPAQDIPTRIVTLTQDQFDMLSTGATLKSHDRNFFFFCSGIFVTALAVVSTALPDSRVMADGWIIGTAVSGLAAIYSGTRAEVASGMVDSVKTFARRS